MKSYQKLEEIFSSINALEGAMSILHWDNAVTMPEGGASARGEHLAALTTVIQEKMTGPELVEALHETEEQTPKLDPWQAANFREMRRTWTHAAAVSSKLMSDLCLAKTESEHVWRVARANNDFKSFAPYLEKVLGMVRIVAKEKSAYLKCPLYDALLDNYDPGRTSAQIDIIFADLEKFLPGFIGEVLDHQQSKGKPLPLTGHFPIAAQRELGVEIMKAMGFNFNEGRLDISTHPFCGGVPSDVRITTRYEEENFLWSLLGVIHETGHALYENQLPKKWRNQPVGRAHGMSIHESQSLIMEMQAARTEEFLSFLHPKMVKLFGVSGEAWTFDNVRRSVNWVQRSLIRVNADEVTYPAHILLRYKLEKAMIEGNLQVKDLPGEWNKGMQELVGITPDSDKNGCMQDIHWPGGDFGYFPTYTLGAMNAAQLFVAAKKAKPGILPSLAKGDFSPLSGWLAENVHGNGSLYPSANDLMVKATGSALDVGYFKQHLRKRYLA